MNICSVDVRSKRFSELSVVNVVLNNESSKLSGYFTTTLVLSEKSSAKKETLLSIVFSIIPPKYNRKNQYIKFCCRIFYNNIEILISNEKQSRIMAQKDAKIEESLKRIGLSENEIKIYLKLLELGSTKAGKIAKETKLDRSSAYNALTNLLNKGFVSYANISNIKWFQPTSPKRILEFINEQREDIKNILPELEGTYKQTKLKGQVTLHKGLKGVESVFRDILRNASENLVFGSEGQLRTKMPYFYEHFVREQKENNITSRILTRIGRKKDYATDNVRFIDNDIESPVVTNIYKNKIAIIIWTDEPEAIIIENKEAADSYRSYFEFMWKNGIKK